MTQTTFSSNSDEGRSYSLAADVRRQIVRLRSVALLMLGAALVIGPVMAWFNSQTLNNSQAGIAQALLREHYMPFYVIALFVGIVGGLWAERYQQVPRQSNFFHSLSPRRGQLLAARVLAVLIIQMVLTLVAVAGIVAVGFASPVISVAGFIPHLVVWGVVHWVHIMLITLMSMSVTLLAGQLAGNTTAQVIMSSVLFLTPAYCGLAIETVLGATTATYMNEGIAERIIQFNPIYPWLMGSNSLDLLYESANSGILDLSGIAYSAALWSAAAYVSYAVVIALALTLTVFLYNRRAAEKAGETLIYRSVGTLIKAEFVILGGLFVGMIFYQMSNRMFWAFALGAVFGAAAVQMVAEMIYAQDPQGWKNHMVSTLAGLVITCVLFGVNSFGLIDYDRHVPSASAVRAVNVEVDGAGTYSRRSATSLEKQDAAYVEKALTAMQGLADNQTDDDRLKGAAADPDAIGEEQLPQENLLGVSVTYETRTGMVTTRRYTIPSEKSTAVLQPLLNESGYVQATYGDILSKQPEALQYMDVSLSVPASIDGSTTVLLDDATDWEKTGAGITRSGGAAPDRAKALYEAIQKDLKARNWKTMTTNSIATVSLEFAGSSHNIALREGDAASKALIRQWTAEGLFGEAAKDMGAAVLDTYNVVVLSNQGDGEKVVRHITDAQTLTDVLANGIIIDSIPADADSSTTLRLTNVGNESDTYRYAFRKGYVLAEENSAQG